jgi:hypothetical protein
MEQAIRAGVARGVRLATPARDWPRGWVEIGIRYETNADPTTLDGYLKDV